MNGDCTPELGSSCGSSGLALSLELPMTASCSASGSIMKHQRDADRIDVNTEEAALPQAPPALSTDAPKPTASERSEARHSGSPSGAAINSAEEPTGGKRKRRHSTL